MGNKNVSWRDKGQDKYTLGNTMGNRSLIDYIITKRNIHFKQLLQSLVNIVSDHNLVLRKKHPNIMKKHQKNYQNSKN